MHTACSACPPVNTWDYVMTPCSYTILLNLLICLIDRLKGKWRRIMVGSSQSYYKASSLQIKVFHYTTFDLFILKYLLSTNNKCSAHKEFIFLNLCRHERDQCSLSSSFRCLYNVQTTFCYVKCFKSYLFVRIGYYLHIIIKIFA